MSRTRASAKAAGTRFETLIATHLAATVDDRIERRRLSGAKDRGDLSGVRHMGGRIVIECKDHGGRLQPGAWAGELADEIGNDDALAGLIVAKRRGTARPGDQWVLTTVDELIALLTGSRDHTEEHQQ